MPAPLAHPEEEMRRGTERNRAPAGKLFPRGDGAGEVN